MSALTGHIYSISPQSVSIQNLRLDIGRLDLESKGSKKALSVESNLKTYFKPNDDLQIYPLEAITLILKRFGVYLSKRQIRDLENEISLENFIKMGNLERYLTLKEASELLTNHLRDSQIVSLMGNTNTETNVN